MKYKVVLDVLSCLTDDKSLSLSSLHDDFNSGKLRMCYFYVNISEYTYHLRKVNEVFLCLSTLKCPEMSGIRYL